MVGVAPEEFDERAVCLEGADGGRNLGVFAVSGDVHVEDVFPIPLFGRARFDLGHVDLAGVEGLEGFDECARPITDGEEKGGAVIARGWAGFLADDEEPRRVGGAVLNGLLENFEAGELCRQLSAEGCGALGCVFPGQMGGLGGGGNLDQVCFREIAEDPVLALTEDLGM